MELVSVSNQDTLNYIQTYIDDLKFDTSKLWLNYAFSFFLNKFFKDFDTWENSIWTSGNDLGEHGQQTWLSLGKHVSQDFLNNHNKFIDHSIKEAGEIEHCLTMVRKPDKFTFNDEICSAQRFFMCERLFHECDFSIFESYKLAVIRPTTSSTTTSKPVEHNDFSVTPGVIN